jgi:hypothetical protein
MAPREISEGMAFGRALDSLNVLDASMRESEYSSSSEIQEAFTLIAAGLTRLLHNGNFNSPVGERVHYHRDNDPHSYPGGGLIRYVDPILRLQLQRLETNLAVIQMPESEISKQVVTVVIDN